MPGGIPLGYRTPRLADVYAAPGSSGRVTATLLRWLWPVRAFTYLLTYWQLSDYGHTTWS